MDGLRNHSLSGLEMFLKDIRYNRIYLGFIIYLFISGKLKKVILVIVFIVIPKRDIS